MTLEDHVRGGDVATTYDTTYEGWYDTLLEDAGIAVLAKAVLGRYDGDVLMVVRAGNGFYGYTRTGYGSCAGCDALQACETMEELKELQRQEIERITWYLTLEAVKQFVCEHDWEGDWANEEEVVAQFRADVAAL